MDRAIAIRTELRPGDLGRIVHWHGTVYDREYEFDRRFEAYVARAMAECVLKGSSRERIWVGERDERIVGCIAIVEASQRVAQLRWVLVDPAARGTGLGTALMDEAVAFSREQGYDSVVLWTVSSLTAAARLYVRAGFRKVEEKPPASPWGVEVVEEKYELRL